MAKLYSQLGCAIIKQVPRLSRICALSALLLTSGEAVSAVSKWGFVEKADAVVVGRIKLSSYFFSFDGLHVNGSIGTTEVLYGGGHAGQEFAYHVVVPCTLWDGCSYRSAWQHWAEMKGMVTQTEIWALMRGPGSSWTSEDPRLAFIYHFSDREKIIEVLKMRKQLGPKP